MFSMNIFRIMGDVSHTISKCVLIFAIHRNKSAEGVSLITQAFYALVFCTRYLDIFWRSASSSLWNFTLKIFYISSSFYIIFIMMKVFARTREREIAWKMAAFILAGSAVLAPFMTMIFNDRAVWGWGFVEILVKFSLLLEAVCILPQLLLLRQTNVPTVLDSFYIIFLGAYRALYCLNWLERSIEGDRGLDGASVVCGIVQTILYIDFAWVYYTRQRVKLRGGGLVDSEDFRRGWLMNRIFGKFTTTQDDEEGAPALGRGLGDDEEDLPRGRNGRPVPAPKASSGWGKRGISVRADDGVAAVESARMAEEDELGDPSDDAPDAKMRDPDDLARALEDDDDDWNEGEDEPVNKKAGVSSGEEWRDGASK